MTPELLYAFTLGMLAVVNPCGFPLLPAYLELFVAGSATGGPVGQVARALRSGALMTVGFVAVFGTLGLVVELGWTAFADHAVTVARYAMAVVGVAMVGLGLAWLLQHPLELQLPVGRAGRGVRRPVAMAVFGASYAVASIGCALPLFLSGVAASFTHRGAAAGAGVFLSYGLGMGTVLIALAVVVALAGPRALRPLRGLSRYVPVVGGGLLVLVGLYLTGYWVTAIVSPVSSAPLEGWVTGVQQSAASFLSAHARLIGALAGALVVGALLAVGAGGRRPGAATSGPGAPVPGAPVPGVPVRAAGVAGTRAVPAVATAAMSAAPGPEVGGAR